MLTFGTQDLHRPQTLRAQPLAMSAAAITRGNDVLTLHITHRCTHHNFISTALSPSQLQLVHPE
ncbi:hypothetical protein A5778_25395 [Mycolicibacterium monacense]|nr:hypothetical protein A5778_25395 [Mycolicibacterium monacense]